MYYSLLFRALKLFFLSIHPASLNKKRQVLAQMNIPEQHVITWMGMYIPNKTNLVSFHYLYPKYHYIF